MAVLGISIWVYCLRRNSSFDSDYVTSKFHYASDYNSRLKEVEGKDMGLTMPACAKLHGDGVHGIFQHNVLNPGIQGGNLDSVSSHGIKDEIRKQNRIPRVSVPNRTL